MKFQVRIDDALEAVNKHFSNHVVELKTATTEWIRQVTAALEIYRDALDRKGLEASYDELQRLQFARPQDNRAQYSRLISALKHASKAGQTILEVNEDESDRIFNDNWDWRQVSKVSNSYYIPRS